MGYLIAGLVAIAAAGVGYGRFQQLHNQALEERLNTARSELQTCGARLENILEDVRSDADVDALTDDDLRRVPLEWLRGPNSPDP